MPLNLSMLFFCSDEKLSEFALVPQMHPFRQLYSDVRPFGHRAQEKFRSALFQQASFFIPVCDAAEQVGHNLRVPFALVDRNVDHARGWQAANPRCEILFVVGIDGFNEVFLWGVRRAPCPRLG